MHIKPTHLITVYLPVLFIDLALSSIYTNSSFYSNHLKLTPTFVGILMAVSTASFTCLAIPCGKLADRVDRRRMLYTACLVLAGISLVLPYCRNKTLLLITFPLLGISRALFWPAYEAWLSEQETESKLIQRVTLFNLFWSIGVTLGPSLSSYLYQDENPFRPFYIAAVLSLFTIALLSLHKSEVKVLSTKATIDNVEILFPSPEVRTIHLNIARCANFASWFGLGVLRRLSPKLILEMRIPPKLFGNYMLTLGGIQTFAFLGLGSGFSTRWHYRLSPILIVQGLAMFSFLVIWKFQHTILWICAFAIIGLSAAFTYFSSIYYGLHRHTDKGNKSGWHEAVLGLGILVGPLFGGIVTDAGWGLQSPYLLCALTFFTAIIVEVFIAAKLHNSKDLL